MIEPRSKFEEVFKCDLREISHMLDRCMEYVGQLETAAGALPADIPARFKWVVTEMLTNAIKHAGVPECTLAIEFENNWLTVEKQDQGKPLALQTTEGKISWPLPEKNYPRELEIEQNGFETLFLTTNDPDSVAFRIKENPGSDLPEISDTTAEHFGLLILTKASDEFIYQYDTKRGTNSFRCGFNLKN